MAWSIGNIQSISIGTGNPTHPGFNLQQDGRSPAITFLFPDEKTAKEARELMLKVVNKASAIVPAK